MRIAQVAPLYESVPPALYGGTERVVSYLTEALVDEGHEVTLVASGESKTRARLLAPLASSLGLDRTPIADFAAAALLLETVVRHAPEFDVIHYHVDHLHFPVSRLLGRPQLTTMHGRLDLEELIPIYRVFSDMPLVSISDAQRAPIPHANWQATVHHGLPSGLYRQGPGDGGYLAFLGRVSAEKRVDRAIEIAKRTGVELRIAAKVDASEAAYFHRHIEPLLDHPLVRFVGEIGEDRKQEFLGRARALLFPIDWPEPFGLVLIESLACGTPIVAFRRGSVPEVVDDRVTGFIVDDVAGAVAAVDRIGDIDRRECRAAFEARFSSRRMAAQYLAVYRRLIAAAAGGCA